MIPVGNDNAYHQLSNKKPCHSSHLHQESGIEFGTFICKQSQKYDISSAPD